jgi:hypothetical protein
MRSEPLSQRVIALCCATNIDEFGSVIECVDASLTPKIHLGPVFVVDLKASEITFLPASGFAEVNKIPSPPNSEALN